MRIGYPCINHSIGCTAGSTFRLRSYTPERFVQTVTANLECLDKMVCFNIEKRLLFFRITSDLIPFASHPVCTFPWQNRFKTDFKAIGSRIRKSGMRISMHPDQFVLLNALNVKIVQQSTAELSYHADVLDLLGCDTTAKIQIHVGGVYTGKEESIRRFITAYHLLDRKIRRRLVIENDDRLYSVRDCLDINRSTGIPVLFDSFHHSTNNNDESTAEALQMCMKTWGKRDGVPMTDYSSQKAGARTGAHADHVNASHFRKYIELTKMLDFDIMIEIKDKEKSALKALKIAAQAGKLQ